MTSTADLVLARTMGRSFVTDPDLELPVRPRLIPELIVCEFEQDGMLFAGAQTTQVIRGSSARSLLPRIVSLMDGTRTLDDLRRLLPELSPEDLSDAVSLLFSRGLIEDGRGTPAAHPELSETESFLGRYNDVSRRNRNRAESMSHWLAASIRVVGPPPLVEWVCGQLAAAGGRLARERNAAADITVAISTGGAPYPLDVLEHYAANSGATLLVRLGEREAHLGPQLVPGVTVCPACLVRMHPHPEGTPPVLLAELWLGIAAQRVLLEISRIAPSANHRIFDQISVGAGGKMVQTARLAPRMPGCPACGITGEAWEIHDGRLLPWLYHQASSLTRRRDLAPRDHQIHYLASNLKLPKAGERLFHSSSVTRLPSPEPLNAPVPWAHGPRPAPIQRISVTALSTLLARMAGESGEGPARRRIAPTGGNLGSVRIWLLSRDVDGLARGAYWYDPHGHTLALRGGFCDSELKDALGTRGELPPCVILGAGDLAKCFQKYHSFAYRLIHFDAGVALAYAYAVAQGLGLLLREYANFDLGVTSVFRISRRWEFPLPTFALGVWTGSVPGEPPGSDVPPASPDGIVLGPDDFGPDLVPSMLAATMGPPVPAHWLRSAEIPMLTAARPQVERLEDVLHLRRAMRRYSRTPPPREILEAIMTVALATGLRRESAGAVPGLVRPILMLPAGSSELAAGVYEFGGAPPSPSRRAAFDAAQARECVNQLALARSPVSLVMLGNLRDALTRRLARGYADTALAAGAAVGMAWLAACSFGLAATAAGGVIAHGFRECAAIDGFNECPLLALHFGFPDDQVTSMAGRR